MMISIYPIKNSVIESCEANVTFDGSELTEKTGKTDTMYESADQGEKAAA